VEREKNPARKLGRCACACEEIDEAESVTLDSVAPESPSISIGSRGGGGEGRRGKGEGARGKGGQSSSSCTYPYVVERRGARSEERGARSEERA